MDTEAQHIGARSLLRPRATGRRRGRAPCVSGTGRPVVSWRRTAVLGMLCTVALLLFSAFVLQPFLIPSGSMEPTLQVGDRVLVNKLAYRFGAEPRRGDVVVFDGTGSFVQETASAGHAVGALLRGAAVVPGPGRTRRRPTS